MSSQKSEPVICKAGERTTFSSLKKFSDQLALISPIQISAIRFTHLIRKSFIQSLVCTVRISSVMKGSGTFVVSGVNVVT